jgi:ectoine hydroxylase-related dioxygenase (phytanoyl-CoA dioxygenase family)
MSGFVKKSGIDCVPRRSAMLSQQQIQFFQTFGFLVLRRLFTPAEMATMNDEFMRRLEAVYHDRPFDGTTRQGTSLMGPDTPFYASLMEDTRFVTITEQLYGDDFIGGGLGGDRYVASTHWHPDVNAEHEGGPKFAFYLDRVDGETGALRVLPASHKSPYHDELRANLGMHMEKAGFDIPALPAFVCDSTPGDVVVFDLRLWHASWGGYKDRRMVSMVHYRNPRTPGGRANLRSAAEHSLQDPLWLSGAERSPRWQRWAEQLRVLATT